MENPAFLESDNSIDEKVRGVPLTMSQRRQSKKYNQHHQQNLPSTHNASHPHGNRVSQSEDGGIIEGSQSLNHFQNGRILGVTGTLGDGAGGDRGGPMVINHMIPAGRVPGVIAQVSPAGINGFHPTTATTLYHEPSLPPLYSTHITSPHHLPTPYLYSCEAPREHDHVYQCAGQRGDPLDHREHHLDQRQRHMDNRRHQDYLEKHHQYIDHHIQPSLDQRPDYHYGGSDYSSTEPIYAQPQLYPHEGSAGTPTSGYPNGQSLPRVASVSSYHISSMRGTPAKYVVRSDSCGDSTSSSTLPTVSAILQDHNNIYENTPAANISHPSINMFGYQDKNGGVSDLRMVNANRNSTILSTPVKLKKQSTYRSWKFKLMQGEGGKWRTCRLVTALLLVILLVLGALTTALYFTIGGVGALSGESPKLIDVTESGSNLVEGEFRIMNQNFWPGLENPDSEEFSSMAHSIETELDRLFLGSVWSHEYNYSQVISFAEGSLIVKAQIILNTADQAAAQKLGTAFLRGLQNRRGNEWLGQFSIDITSIRFTEVLVDIPISSTTTSQPPTTEKVNESSTIEYKSSPNVPHLNVGWGEWGPWSSCSPCSPQYDQIRTRECRLDGGHGLLVSSIEPCLPSGRGNQLQGSSGDMETRPCQCDHILNKDSSPSTVGVTTITSTATMTSTPEPLTNEKPNKDNESVDKIASERLCDSCLPGEVCVGLQGESYPTCRPALDSGDRTGCGGLCVIDSEVCQALGSRAFQCHSASLCLHDEWRCDDGLCIPFSKRCDGHMNCYDRSDEQQCKCRFDQFKCGNNTSCLPLTSKCDGKIDCWDGSDEANCTTSSVSQSSSSATEWPIVGMGLMNPQDVFDNVKPTTINAGTEIASQLPSSVMGGTRAGTSAMNRTAVGLSILSNRERELLS